MTQTVRGVGRAPADNDEALPRALSTRERILDVALDLFIEKGFDKTSLREIAEQLGFTKAALYYHFASKDDILMGLHLRLHEFGRDALSQIGDEPVTLAVWRAVMDQFVDQMLTHRKIFLMHERNQAALEKLHSKDHEAEHDDLQAQFQRVLNDTRVSVSDRVRMACSFGSVFGGLFLSSEAFLGTSTEELGGMMRDALHDLLT
ncbi:MAG TPA: helix-turn-helix domain-containing protein [Acidimicrobiales bacterium]|nr:helix-turn-helix domain-containing protein [Acidimicrobiales bacterium]